MLCKNCPICLAPLVTPAERNKPTPVPWLWDYCCPTDISHFRFILDPTANNKIINVMLVLEKHYVFWAYRNKQLQCTISDKINYRNDISFYWKSELDFSDINKIINKIRTIIIFS